MKLFNTLKGKAGNAILPVVGTILGLTILAGSVVGVALNSSKIVYRQNNLQQQTDARNILYIACKYFCDEKNNGTSDADILRHLQDAFGPGLRITTDRDDSQKYYIWYPNKYKPGYSEYVPGEDSVEEWLKATIKQTNADTDGGTHGKTGMNDVLFSEKAKLDEKFNIGNMATIYMTDNALLPVEGSDGRKFDVTMISKVESDVDTFEEAFAYAIGGTTLLIDDIAFEFYGYDGVNGLVWFENPEIIYHTGNLGGNYYWQTTNNSDGKVYNYKEMVYKQEIDDDLMYGFFEYANIDGYKFVMRESDGTSYKLYHTYTETNDMHYFEYYAKKDENDDRATKRTYTRTSRQLAEAISPYIYYRNIFKLVLQVPSFKNKIDSIAYDTAKNKRISLIGVASIFKPDLITPPVLKETEWLEDKGRINLTYEYTWTYKFSGLLAWMGKKTGTETIVITLTMNDVMNYCNQLGITIDTIVDSVYDSIEDFVPTEEELQSKVRGLMVAQYGNENNMENIEWEYTDVNNWSMSFQYNWGGWLDPNRNYYASTTPEYLNAVKDWINSFNTEAAKKKRMMESIVDSIGYNYIPNTTLADVVGGFQNTPDGTVADDTTMTGYREQAYVSKMAEWIFDHDEDVCRAFGFTDLTSYSNSHGGYTISFREPRFEGSNKEECLQYHVIFLVSFGDKSQPVRFDTHLYFKLKTYHPYNTDQLSNGNCDPVSDGNGRTEYIFRAVDIKNASGQVLTSGDLETTLCPITTLYYENRRGDSQYVNSRVNESINNNGLTYEQVDVIPSLVESGVKVYQVGSGESHNIYYNGDLLLPEDNAILRIKKGYSLFINGSLLLRNNQKLVMDAGVYDDKGNATTAPALLFINGNLDVDFYVERKTNIFDSIMDSVFSLDSNDINYFKTRGVDILAYGADIFVNGDFDYKGIKTPKGTFGAYKQRLMDSEECEKGTQKHDSNECRGIIKGNFIVNGDVIFRALNENHNKSTIGSSTENFTNAFSNPLINATFYVDGVFDMRGLWTSGLYDTCRANFVFSKSIIQPEVSLGALYDDDLRDFCSTHGFLFMICEDAINFSKLNFAAVNLFTPYNMLVGALQQENINDRFDITTYIDDVSFRTFYPDISVMNYWGLPSILRSGFAKMYTPGDVGEIKVENQVYGNEVTAN